MQNILIATIGTRDLMFQISSGLWYNIGDDQMQDGEIIGEQAEIISDLGFGQVSFRELTAYLLENIEQYRSRIRPVIIGKLLADQAANLEYVYLIGTDQAEGVAQRKKDTVHACSLIQDWLLHNYQIPTKVITLGEDGENPSNFEQMFRWWQQVWRQQIKPQPEQPILLCLKGCVAQTAEAGRISGLSSYGDRIQFFDFIQNLEMNRQGFPSEYSGPILGTNYLWDRTQQQALQSLNRYDYSGLAGLLKPYISQDPEGFSFVPTLIEAGIVWNQGKFYRFFQLAKSALTGTDQARDGYWWWMAYEQAYLASIRLTQKNTAEAMLHSFRAIEGALWKWASTTFVEHVQVEENKFPLLRPSILDLYPSLESVYMKWKGDFPSTQLRGEVLRTLLEVSTPAALQQDFQAFWSEDCRARRNVLSHRLGGLSYEEVLQSWGTDIRNQTQWEKRILTCLNILTGKPYKTMSQASLLSKVHEQIKIAIADYTPPDPN